ncbi:MAG: TIGR02300 family protein [Fimbriimonadaceae bacterium]|nr:TIGR02300 family protein [Alphaproteobacteria bacterium]
MAKPNLGTKRLCGSCDTKFYDLDRNPIICPKCGTTFVVVQTAVKPEVKAKAAPKKKPVEVEETDDLDDEDVELVSLEDADDDDDSSDSEDDNTFLEDDEEDGPNLSDIVGGVKSTDDD